MKTEVEKSEKGQSLVFVLLLMFAFIVLLALVIDGGNSYFQRRNAQNAADAGALAATRNYCEFKDVDRAKAEALKYVLKNEAFLYEPPTVNTSQGTVNVKTEINFSTFFGNIIGRSDITAVAEAESGCEQPCLGEGVLPVVWICNPGGVGSPPGSTDCDQLPIDDDKLDHHLNTPAVDPPGPDPACIPINLKGNTTGYVCPELSIVMDNIDLDTLQCDTYGGVLDCDFDGDNEDDYISASNRGWADLDGRSLAYDCIPPPPEKNKSDGDEELKYWIEKGYSCPFFTHTWVGDQKGGVGGGVGSLFGTVEARRVNNPIVILPVFDDSCPSDPEFDDSCTWHSGTHPPGDLVHDFPSTPNYYHVSEFSAFYITCVQTKNGDCPGAEAFYQANWNLFHGGGDPLKGADFNAIEGYFLKGYVPGLKGGCGYNPDMDVFSVYLNK